MLRALFSRRLRDKRAAGIRMRCDDGPARLAVPNRVLLGTVGDLSAGGCFFATDAQVKIGTRGAILRDGARGPVPVRVAWKRATTQGLGPGVGLAFD